jgi:hypothetical protein
MKLEETRREYLDTKAGTYIGLLGLSVTILTAFGGVVILQSGQIREITNIDIIYSQYLLILLYFLYFSVIVLFIISVIFAFRAYSTGSLGASNEPKSPRNGILSPIRSFLGSSGRFLINILIPKDKNIYKWIDRNFIALNKESCLVDLRKFLIDKIDEAVKINYDLNNEKAKRILRAYISTILGIFILLILIILLGLITGIGLI